MQELIEYFKNLLIMQYKKSKAKLTIEKLVKELFAEETTIEKTNRIFGNIVLNKYDFYNSENISNTQTQKAQLKVLAKYILGSDDDSLNIIDANHFKFSSNYIDNSLGFTTEHQIQGTNLYGPPLMSQGNSFSYITYSLIDTCGLLFCIQTLEFLSLIKNDVLSLGNLNEKLYNIFNDKIYVTEGTMSIVYNYHSSLRDKFANKNDLIQEYFKKFYPRPMGYSISIICYDEESSSS